MSQKRISYIDTAKGIGILLVLIGHSEYPSTHLITWISSFHMPLFFILSGILFAHTGASTKKTKPFLKKKLCSILVPYATFSLLSILASAILDYASFPAYLWTSLIQTISFYGISVLWFLPTLFFSELAFFFIKKHTSSKITILITGCILTLSILGNELYHHYFTATETYSNLFLSCLCVVLIRTGIAISFLTIGFYLYHAISNQKLTTGNYLVLSAGFLLLNLFLGFKNGGVDLNQIVFRNYVLYYLAAFCGTMFVLCLCNALPALPPLTYMGKNSLIIMATHMNCRFYGACFLVADVVLRFLPQAGLFGYYLVVAACMAILEIIAITVINRFFPFLAGKPAKRLKLLK